ncbi:Ferredoxin [Methanosarcina horonobensis HB-1 = JCM 15518]|uniref:Ferredoxin n=1 Tax=Methanosarcina horonobensis HB-1 = JCM 15518 TaxID=1434110 RepID=A0A0E3WV72_9EURY|nr:4Fe-4S binding protein [Methanosarcina horonobensis]AKB77300.1 Ferredoxin [Methanosarcina horonobensis HB-1 = JCM 15518]
MSDTNGYVVVFGCKRCGKCRDVCPVGAIYEENELAKIDPEKCNLCMKCIDECTNRSIIYMD